MITGFQINIDDNLEKTIDKASKSNPNIIQTFLTKTPYSVSKKTIIRFNPKESKIIKNKLKKYKLKLLIHSNYLLNYCSYPPDSKRIKWALDYYLDELTTANRLGAIGSIIHIGSKKTLTKKEAYSNFVNNIKYIIKNKPKKIKIILELTAGGGGKIAYKIEDFKELWDKFTLNDKKHIRICLDTAHIFLSGYPIHKVEELKKFIENFDKSIGLKYVEVFHLNDSKYKLGSHKNVHNKIGEGYLFNKNKGGSLDSFFYIISISMKYNKIVILENSKEYEKDYKKLLSFLKNDKKTINKFNDKKLKDNKKIIINTFKEMSDIYKVLGDNFRYKAYQKAVSSIEKYNGDFKNKIDCVGKSMKNKIEEILNTGQLKLLKNLKNKTSSTKNLQRIYGIGPKESKKFINLNIHSIKNLKEALKNKNIKLTSKQKLGLKYLNNLELAISPSLMKKYKGTIHKRLNKINKKIKTELVGSFLTGKAQKEGAHDIDILITYPNVNIINKSIIELIKDSLKDIIIEILSIGKNRMSFLCKINSDKNARHVDILITTLKSHYPAILYFGSGSLKSRKIRKIAKDKGYKLNEYELLNIKTGKKYYSKKDIDRLLKIDKMI